MVIIMFDNESQTYLTGELVCGPKPVNILIGSVIYLLVCAIKQVIAHTEQKRPVVYRSQI